MPQPDADIDVGDDVEGQAESGPVYPVAVFTASGKKIQAVVQTDTSGNAVFNLMPPNTDFIDLSYTGSNLTGVVYKSGGAGGTTLRTIAITYTVANLIDTVTIA